MATVKETRGRAPRTKPADTCRLEVVIRGERYTARPNPNAPGLAWRLRKADGIVYDVTPHGCTCADSEYRHAGRDDGGCKHVRALRALGLLPPADEAVEDDPTDPDNGDPRHWPEWTDRQCYTVTRQG